MRKSKETKVKEFYKNMSFCHPNLKNMIIINIIRYQVKD